MHLRFRRYDGRIPTAADAPTRFSGGDFNRNNFSFSVLCNIFEFREAKATEVDKRHEQLAALDTLCHKEELHDVVELRCERIGVRVVVLEEHLRYVETHLVCELKKKARTCHPSLLFLYVYK